MKIKGLLQILHQIIHAPETLLTARLSERYFIRNRKMSFTEVLCFFFDMRKTSLQTRLNLFFDGEPMISEQAFSKARSHFDYSPFETMVRAVVAKEYSGDHVLPLWNGYHVFAVDGSYLWLPKNEELREAFGVRGGGDTCVCAGMSTLYDVLHGWPIDPILTHSDMNERTECVNHLDYLCGALPHIAQKSLILLDRGYPSKELFQELESRKFHYVARCARNYGKKIVNAPMGDSLVQWGGQRLRVIKFLLSSGELETLVTNLFDVPFEQFPALYAMRWGIEGAYNQLKNVVCLENFSGRTENAVRQDFWASMVLMISVAVFQAEANEKVQAEQKRKKNKHIYKVRTSTTAVTLRDQFVFQVLRKNKLLALRQIPKIIAALAYSLSPVRPDRSFPRRMNSHPPFNLHLMSHL